MKAAELLSGHLTPLQLNDTVADAREKLAAGSYKEYPVVEENHFVGLLKEESLEEKKETDQISLLQEEFDHSLSRPDDFFLVPLKLMHQRKLSLLPVVNNEGEYKGTISAEEILETAAQYNAAGEPGGIIVLQMSPLQFSISEIGRIVESNNAKIIHLNTWTDAASGQLMVAIKINKADLQDVLATLDRYEYNVVQYFGENLSEEGLKKNFEHLMHYLNL
jgi:predicted transcriptional regulator